MVLHVDPDERAGARRGLEDPGHVGLAELGRQVEAHLAELQAHVAIQAPAGQGIEHLEVAIGRGRRGRLGLDRLAQDVDRRPAAAGVQPIEGIERLAEGLPGDEPGDHRAGERQAGRQPAERRAAGQRQQRRAHRPLRQLADGAHVSRPGALVAERGA